MDIYVTNLIRKNINYYFIITILVCVPFKSSGQVNINTPGWYKFGPSYLVEDSPIDVSFLNEKPADMRIKVEGGYFKNSEGHRVRFLGTNVIAGGAFPQKKMAPEIARHMAQLGINVVRFHHIDAKDIWLPGLKDIDPIKLDRLHWFIYQLKSNGIYTNLNLHTTRTYPGLEEFELARSFRFGKILDNFYEPYLKQQKMYAQSLLGSINPYTKLKLSEDPAVAFVEVNNENSLLNLNANLLEKMPGVHRDSLTMLWQKWLKSEYSSINEVYKSWNKNRVSLGPQLIRDSHFLKGLDEWSTWSSTPRQYEANIVKLDDGKNAVEFNIRSKGDVSWAYQFNQVNIAIEEQQLYTLKFRARSNISRTIMASLSTSDSPWITVGIEGRANLTEEWNEYKIVGRVKNKSLQTDFRVNINLGNEPGVVWVSDISLQKGSSYFKPKKIKSMDEVTLPESSWPELAWRDFRRFLIYTEQSYVENMREFLSNKLSVKSLIIHSQAYYGGEWGLYREAKFSDYIDMHAYWEHPVFHGKPWDRSNWTIPNTSMVGASNKSTFEHLGRYKIKGKPFSVSEYNHAAPNDHAVELFPMLSAYASFQDWDAIYQFNYANSYLSYGKNKIDDYFSSSANVGQLAFMPIAALAFRNSYVPKARTTTTYKLSLENMMESIKYGFSDESLINESKIPPQLFYGSNFSSTFDENKGSSLNSGENPNGAYIDSNNIYWNPNSNDPIFKVDTPKAKMVIGNIIGKKIKLGDVIVEIKDTGIGTWACIALASKDGKNISESNEVIMALATRVENSNMLWNKNRTSVGDNWGEAPIVAQKVLANISFSGVTRPTMTPLSSNGKRLPSLFPTSKSNKWKFSINNTSPSIWYVIER